MQIPPRGFHTFLSKRLFMILLCLLAIVAMGLLGTSRFSSPLPRGAYPVCSTAGWATRSKGSSPDYDWLANGDLVYLETMVTGKLRICYQKMDARGPVGAVRHGPELPSGLQTSSFSVSPDEQWVAYNQHTGDTTQDQTTLVSADGTKRRTVSPVGETFLTWLSDSRSFLCGSFNPPNQFKIYHLDSPPVETISGAIPGEILITPGIMRANDSNFLLGAGSPFTQISPTTTWPSAVLLRSFQVSQPHIVQQTWQTLTPTAAGRLFATVSPDNSHLLWQAISFQSPPFWREGKFLPWGVDFEVKTNYFLSDLQGNNMHPILTYVNDGSPEIEPTWAPDSKHLSFLYKDHLYLIPVD